MYVVDCVSFYFRIFIVMFNLQLGVIQEFRSNPVTSTDLANLGLFKALCVAPDSGAELFQIFQCTNYSFFSCPAV